MIDGSLPGGVLFKGHHRKEEVILEPFYSCSSISDIPGKVIAANNSSLTFQLTKTHRIRQVRIPWRMDASSSCSSLHARPAPRSDTFPINT